MHHFGKYSVLSVVGIQLHHCYLFILLYDYFLTVGFFTDLQFLLDQVAIRRWSTR